MELGIFGKIQCDQISDSRALRKFADKQIRNWITRKFTEVCKKPVTYFVELRRAGSGHTFDCHIRIRLDNQTWVGSEYRGEIHQALIHCLRQMMPVPVLA
jgi:hypothetical protein